MEPGARFCIADPSPKDLSLRYQEPCWVQTCTRVKLRAGLTLGLGPKKSSRARPVLAADSTGHLTVCDLSGEDVLVRKKVTTI